MRAAAFAVPANYILAALPRAAYRRMLGKLERVPFGLGEVLYEAGTSPRHVYFPNDSMVSLIGMTQERNPLEVGLVGREGMVGCSLALGVKVSPTGALVQGAGSAMRMGAADFSREFQRNAPLRREVLRSAGVQMATAMQIAACNNAHRLQPRLARWLLMTRDRLATNRFAMTQEFLAQMLGTRRSTVNAGASALQRAGLITYSRGVIVIGDLERLRAAACSCYEGIRRLTARVTGSARPS
jgi:CRP-like cAMP-binding protein